MSTDLETSSAWISEIFADNSLIDLLTSLKSSLVAKFSFSLFKFSKDVKIDLNTVVISSSEIDLEVFSFLSSFLSLSSSVSLSSSSESESSFLSFLFLRFSLSLFSVLVSFWSTGAGCRWP
ncbi:hypothetical protein ACR2XS_25555 [Klebsiella pneumoniae]